MEERLPAVERAFELARSGRVKTIGELRKVLSSEGYVASLIEGPTLHRQLKALIIEAARNGGRSAKPPA